MTPPTPKASKVVLPFPTAAIKADKASNMKWGASVMQEGFCIVPSILLRAQPRLGLNPTQLAVLMQFCDFWWDPHRKPYPSKETIAERLGLSPRQTQRYVAELEGAGLIKRIKRFGANGGRLSNEYDLSGLVAKLKALAPEFAEAREIKAKAGKKGGIKPAQAKGA